VILALLVLVPLAFDTGTSELAAMPKYTLVVEGAIVLAALWALEWLTTRTRPWLANGLHIPVLLLVGWTALTTATSSNPRVSLLGYHGSYDGLTATVALAVVFFAAADAFSMADVKKLFAFAYFGAGGVALFVGLFQLHDLVLGGPAWDPLGRARQETWLLSTLGNPNHLAGFLAMLVPMGVALAIVHRSAAWRWAIGVVGAVGAAEMLYAATRGAWLAAFVALGLMAALSWRQIRSRVSVRSLAAIGLVAVLVPAAVLIANPSSRRHFAGKVQFGAASTLGSRTGFWQAALDVTKDHPLVGSGPDTFRLEFPRYQSASFVRHFGADGQVLGPHDSLLNVLYSRGAPGLAVLLLVIGWAGVVAARAWRRARLRPAEAVKGRRPDDTRILLLAVIAALVAYLVQSLFNVEQTQLALYFWVLLGLLCVAAREHEPEPATGRPAGASALVGAMAVLVVILAGAAAWWAGGAYRADRIYRGARDTQLEAVALAHAGRWLEAEAARDRAEGKLAAARRANQWDPSYPLDYATHDYTLAQGAVATDQTALALRLYRAARARWHDAAAQAPDFLPLDNAAAAGLEIHRLKPADTGALATAIADLRRTLALNPRWTQPALQLAKALQARSQDGEAMAVLDRALRLAPRDAELLRAAARLAAAHGETQRSQALWRRLLAVAPRDKEAVAATTIAGP
jgi:O-antigen ligase